jgi:transcriptional regulator with XRE-family HTH domain
MKTQADTQEIPKWVDIIKRLRRDLDETQAQFGERFGVTQSAVAQWEAGTTAPPAAVLLLAMERSAHMTNTVT